MPRLNRRLIILLGLGAIALTFPLWFRLIHPSAFTSVRCVGMLADGSLVKASGNDCIEPHDFEQVVKLKQNDDGTIEFEGDTTIFELDGTDPAEAASSD
ncbi:MAG: hypothetical protein WBA57_20940 [Elainellaceae cyanobacterium]